MVCLKRLTPALADALVLSASAALAQTNSVQHSADVVAGKPPPSWGWRKPHSETLSRAPDAMSGWKRTIRKHEEQSACPTCTDRARSQL